MNTASLPRVSLLRGETPLHPLPRYSAALGHSGILLKRDDVMTLGMGGNKVRSLEFWLGEAKARGCDVVLVCGLPPSNLCRLTAAACCAVGLECRILHNGEAPHPGEAETGNQLLNRLMGVQRIYLGAVDEHARTRAAHDYADALRAEGRTPYLIGDEVTGALGYFEAARELALQCARDGVDLRHVVISASAGPTESGLMFGLAHFMPQVRVHLISVEYDETQFWHIAEEIFAGLRERVHLDVQPRQNARFYADWLGEGYGVPTAESIDAVRQLAGLEGVFMETTYNAKTLAGLRGLIARSDLPQNETVCLWHTGGAPALFGQAAALCAPPNC